MCTLSYGKVKLVLKKNLYFVESRHSDVIQKLLKDAVIQECLPIEGTPTVGGITSQTAIKKIQSMPNMDFTITKQSKETDTCNPEGIDEFYEKISGEEDTEKIKSLDLLSFEVRQECIETVQKRCIELEFPLLAEYDFRLDVINPNLNIDLKPATVLRFFDS